MDAVRFAKINRGKTLSAKGVGPIINDLKMLRIYARPNSAKMVNLQAIRDRFHKRFVGNPVG